MNTPNALHRAGLAGLGLLLGAWAVPSLAQQDSYFYGGLSLGESHARIDEARISASLLGAGLATASMTRDERDTGYKVFGGYQLNRNLGIEAGFFKLGKFGFESITTPAGRLAGEISLEGFHLDLVAALPVTESLSFIGRLGVQNAKATDHFSGGGAVTVLDANPSERSTQPKYGLGLQYEMTRNFLVRAEVERYRVNDAVGNKGDVNLYSVGLVIPFGRAPRAAAQRVMAPPPAYVEKPADPAPIVAAAVAPPPPLPAPIMVEPPQPAQVVPPRRVSFSADSLFGFDLAEIRPEGRQSLDVFANELKGTRFEVITVEGHTDRLGTTAYNQALSTRRAEAVKAYLVNTSGIDASKVAVRAKGENDPVTKPETCKGRKAGAALIACLQPDRRVEVEVSGTR
jgi:OOP family OmpA-OmpF porin